MFGSGRVLHEIPVPLADVEVMVQRYTGMIGRAPDPEREGWA